MIESELLSTPRRKRFNQLVQKNGNSLATGLGDILAGQPSSLIAGALAYGGIAASFAYHMFSEPAEVPFQKTISVIAGIVFFAAAAPAGAGINQAIYNQKYRVK
jgi:hypothetical protein